ncbi:WG repeat-containing protein [Neobacillus sp. D3-1R]|uniref:WG repeat-containing protein n=1 Tax=Neobacillus sp. D3-1R TaxID=3445778 RepID=UPI003FA06103
MNQFYQDLQRCLPLGAQILWDDWRQRPSVYMEDMDGDGQEEMVVSFRYETEGYLTIFKHDYSNWYPVWTTRATNHTDRVKGIDLYPASVREVGEKKWGYINHKGKFVSPVRYEDVQDFQSNGLAAVKLNGKYGLINQYGQFIVTPRYNYINPFSEGRAVVQNDKGFKIMNARGKELTNKSYSFIANFKNNRAMFAGTNEEGAYLYGYLNRQGKEVIPLQYEYATDFNEGKAVVKLSDGTFQLINQNGKIIQSFPYALVGEFSEGLMSFQEKSDSKFGYINEEGKVMIEPSYTGAQPFQSRRAVVNMGEDFRFQYGLINRLGSFVIEPKYNNILMLGEERIAVGKAIDEKRPFIGSIYAIADINGNFLTEFKFTDVHPYRNGFASVTDLTSTYFINKSGKVAKQYPVVKGSGELSFEGELIKGMIDLRLRYYDLKGLLVWSQNQIISLSQSYRVIEKKYKPNKDYLVYYPEIQGMRFEGLQNKVNKKLEKLSGVGAIEPNNPLDYSYTGDFNIFFYKNRLVVLELNGYKYPFGAAHGMPSKIYAHVDLESGVFYKLKDLFKKDSDYVGVLSKIVGEQIKNDPQYSYVFPGSYKGISEKQPFYVDQTNVYLYFQPYEIAPYAAGFPTFKIPFAEIETILNKSGAFWNSFH